MMKFTPIMYAVLALALHAPTSGSTHGPEDGPRIGDPAPRFQVSQWIRGEPIRRLERGRIHVVEFWATWCAPCIAVMPHLADLERRYADKGVAFIAVNVMDEDLEGARALIQRMGEKMVDRIAIDTPIPEESEGVMAQSWLRQGFAIPHSVVVDQEGRVAWFGHPRRLDRPLKAIVDGTYDPVRQAAIDKAFWERDAEIAVALRAKRWKEVLTMLDRIHDEDPEIALLYAPTRVKALVAIGNLGAAEAFSTRVAAESGDVTILGHLASEMLKFDDRSRIDLDRVLELARKADPDGDSMDPVSLSALARAYEAKGRHAEVIVIWERMLGVGNPMIDADSVRARIKEAKRKSKGE